MRRLIALLAVLALPVLGPVLGSQAFAQAPVAPVMQGLFLLTDYPSQTVRAGEITTIRVKMQNSGLAPEPMALSLSGVPAGWKIDILGGGQAVASAMPGQNESVTLQLRVEVPKDAKPGSQQVVLSAKGNRLQSAELPLTLTVGTEAPAKLSLKSRLPSLRGTPRSSFEYTVTVGNDSGKDLTVALSAQGPANFQTTFTEGFGSNEISSIPVEAGQTKDIKVKVTPPRDVKAGDYPVLVKVAAEGATAELRVTLQVSGQGRLALSAKGDRLSGEAEIGKTSTYTLVLSNDGTAAVDEIEMAGTVPTGWKVEFNPKTLATLAPNEKKEVQVLVTPSDKAIAGDYVASFRASARGESSAADFRITVTTSTLWGLAGLGIIAVALLVLLGAVARFGRR
ncbi:MAG: NEW3 domain-containing protein [Reyranella sp.]|nr:NEW3 domain-containing protein [Reyranella sp.]